jgi:hypothetical protein
LELPVDGIGTPTIICRVINGEIGEKTLEMTRSLFLSVVRAKTMLGFSFAPFLRASND